MKVKNIIFLFIVITMLSCTKKFEELENIDNLIADEDIVLFEVTNVSFIPQSAFVSDVQINFKSKYFELSDELRNRINQIAVYKNGAFQFIIESPSATTFIDENEMRGATHCYQFAFARGSNGGGGSEISRLSAEECFKVE